MKPTLTPKDFFLHFALFIALYVSTFSFLRFIFDIINFQFPDAQYDYFDPYSSSIRWAISTLIVFFPVYILVSKQIGKEIIADPIKQELGFRKWLIYLTLFLTGLTVVIDVVTLLNSFLEGQLTIRFILKVLAVLIVSGGIFKFYLSELKTSAIERTVIRRKLAYIVSGIILFSIIGGFAIIGSPAKQRMLREDNRRLSDLSTIQNQVISYWEAKQTLPVLITDLKDSLILPDMPSDPKTGENYGYEKVANTTFKICATFALASKDDKNFARNSIQRDFSMAYPMAGIQGSSWEHEAGYQCFERTIDPDKFSPLTRGKLPFEEVAQ